MEKTEELFARATSAITVEVARNAEDTARAVAKQYGEDGSSPEQRVQLNMVAHDITGEQF